MHTTTTATAETEARDGSAVPPVAARSLQGGRHVTLSGRDVWRFIEAAASTTPLFAWRDPARDHTFVGWGMTGRFGDPRQHAFGALRGWCSSHVERWIGDTPPPDGLPLCVGGFSFAPGQPQGAWAGWPATNWFVPKFLAYQMDGGRQGILLRDGASLTDALSTSRLRAVAGVPSLHWRSEPNHAAYCRLVHDAVNDIGHGHLRKVVAARRCSVRSHRPFDLVATLDALRDGHGDAITFALSDGQGWLIGASPETLVAVRRGELRTHALAGTSERGADPDGRRLARSEKDLDEHRMVVEGIASALAPICGRLEHGDPRVVAAGPVQHLMTPIRGRLREGMGAVDAVARMHPTAALCGSPREEAARWIATHEATRGWYGGPVGWLTSDGDGVLAVAIRSLLMRPTEALAYVGAGIVAASDPELEWQETEAKLRTVSRALRVADAGGAQ